MSSELLKSNRKKLLEDEIAQASTPVTRADRQRKAEGVAAGKVGGVLL